MSVRYKMTQRSSCFNSVSFWWMLFMLHLGNCQPKGYVEGDFDRNHTPFVIIPSKAAFWCSCSCAKHAFHISEFVWIDRKKWKLNKHSNEFIFNKSSLHPLVLKISNKEEKRLNKHGCFEQRKWNLNEEFLDLFM